MGPLGAFSGGVTNFSTNDGADVKLAEPAQTPESTPEPPVVNVGNSTYHSYGEMTAEIKQIAKDHPNICTLTSIGKSTYGRDIWALKVSDNPTVEESDEAEVYFNSAHHSREWMTIEFSLFLANYLTNNYGSNTNVNYIVQTKEVWIIPCVNVDGRVYDGYLAGDDPQRHARPTYGWRKNVRDNNANGFFEEAADGVDLNRNYGYMWGGAGASSNPVDDTYGGPTAFSEPETSAVRDFVRAHNFKMAISYHTAASLILYPEGWNWIKNKDTTILQNIAYGLSSRITNTVGDPQATYTPEQSSSLYTTTGSDDDWLYGDRGIFAYCIEMAPSQGYTPVAPYDDNFHPDPAKVSQICNDNLNAALWFAAIADNPYQIIDHVKVVPRAQEARIKRGTSLAIPINVTNDGRRASDTYTLTTWPAISGWTISMTPSSQTIAKNATAVSTLRMAAPAGATPGIYRILVNATSTANATCKNWSFVNVLVTYGSDVADVSQGPFAEQGTYPRGIYGITSSVMNVGDAATPAFNTYCNVSRLGTTTNRILFNDYMESGTAKWFTTDYDGTVTTNYWHQVTTSSHSATRSWYCGPTTPANYADNVVQTIDMAQAISLRTATNANFSFWTSYNMENGFDFLNIEGSRDAGKTWEYITRYTGTATAWTRQNVSLNAFLGTRNFKLRIKFSSDGGTTSTGPYFDDIFIMAQIPAETNVYGPVAQNTPALAVNGTAQLSGWSYNFATGGKYRVTTWTGYSADLNASNNATSLIINIDGTKTFPAFAGVGAVKNTPLATSLNASWTAVQGGNPVTYRLMRFNHSPTIAEIAAATNSSGSMNAYVYDGPALYYANSGLTVGSTYYYVCRAHDALGNWDWNSVVKSGVAESQLYFQTQSPLGSYKGLNNLPFEGAVQTSLSASLSAVGQYKITDSWITDAYSGAQDTDGVWRFRVNGMDDYASGHGYLYAKVYRYNGGSPVLLFQTANDDEDVAGFAGTYHEFYWTHTAGANQLPSGDRVFVELWLDCTSVTAGSANHKYTFTGSTQASGPHHAWFGDNDDKTEFELTTPNSVTEFTNTYYTNAGTSDNVYAGPCTAPGTGDEIFVKYKMAVTEDPATVTRIQLTHEARHSLGAGISTMYAFNQTSQAWDQVSTTMTFTTANVDYNMTRNITVGCSNYIANGIMLWGVYESVSNLQVSVDLAQAIITYNLPVAAFTFEYDYGLTPSSVATPIRAATSSAYFNIPVVAGWNLISTPLIGTTAMPAAFQDSQGDTTWDRAMWYNPRTPNDKWKQYNANWNAALNDLATADRTQGIWINVSAVGNGYINVSGTLPSTSAIPLKAGWNLIGYPALNDASYTVAQLKSATGATIVEGFAAGQTYKTVVLADATVLKRGQGYWVYVPADATWNINW